MKKLVIAFCLISAQVFAQGRPQVPENVTLPSGTVNALVSCIVNKNTTEQALLDTVRTAILAQSKLVEQSHEQPAEPPK